MSLLTRCPACTTCYRVVPDQLRVSEGWVRCGQCAEIFDAAANFLENARPVRPEQQTSPSGAVVDALNAALEPESDQSNPAKGAVPAIEPVEALPVDLGNNNGSAQLPLAKRAPDDAALDADARPAMNTNEGHGMNARIDFDIDPADRITSHGQAAQEDPDWPMNIVPEKVTFLKPVKPQGPPKSAWALCLWSLLACGLVLALLAQWVNRERDMLVLRYAQLQPALHAVCSVLHCQIEPLRRIDSLVIDASSLTAAGNSAYRLNMVIKNQGDLPVAFPGIELTLIDALDQVLVRRALRPVDLGAPSASLGVSQSWPVNLGLEFTGSPSLSGVVGYRLLAFYP